MYTPHWLLYAFSTRHGCRLQSDDDDDDDDDVAVVVVDRIVKFVRYLHIVVYLLIV